MLASVGGNELKLYSVSRERELKLTNVVDGLHSYNLGAVAWNHTNQVVAIAGSEPKISLVQASDGQLLSTIPFSAEEAFEGPTRAIAFSNNSRYLASSSNRVVNLWDFKRRNLKASFTGHKGDVNAIAIAPEGDIVAGDSTGMLRIWDIKKGTSSKDLCVQTSSDQDPTKKTNSNVAVNCVQVSQFGAMRIASGYADGYLALWDYSTLQLLRSQRVHNGDVNALAFSPKNSRLVATTGMDGRVALVDTGSRTLSAPSAVIEIADRLTCVSFHEDAIHVAVGSHSGGLYVYDWRNVSAPVCRVEGHSPFAVGAISFQTPAAFGGPSTPHKGNVGAARTPPRSSDNKHKDKDKDRDKDKDKAHSTPMRRSGGSTPTRSGGSTPVGGHSRHDKDKDKDKNSIQQTQTQKGLMPPPMGAVGDMHNQSLMRSSISSDTSNISHQSVRSEVSSLSTNTLPFAINNPQNPHHANHPGIYPDARSKVMRSPARGDPSRGSVGNAAGGVGGAVNTASANQANQANNGYNANSQPHEILPPPPGPEIENVSQSVDAVERAQARARDVASASANLLGTRQARQQSQVQSQSQIHDSVDTNTAGTAGDGGAYTEDINTNADQWRAGDGKNVASSAVDSTSSANAQVYSKQHIFSSSSSSSSSSTVATAVEAASSAGQAYSHGNSHPQEQTQGHAQAHAQEEAGVKQPNRYSSSSFAPADVDSQSQSEYVSQNHSQSQNQSLNRRQSNQNSNPSNQSNSNRDSNRDRERDQEDFDELSKRVQPVSGQELSQALELLRYDVHKEIGAVTREQVRQFSLAKEDMLQAMGLLGQQLQEVLQANKELREENERLRRIY